MCKPAKARFDAADDDRLAAVGAADEVAVDRYGVIGPLAHHAAGGIGVGFPVGFGDGIVVDHRVHIAAHDEKAQARLAEGIDRSGILPVGLRDDADLIARVLEHARDDRVAKRRMIDIAVADDVDKVALLPSAPLHIGAADR